MNLLMIKKIWNKISSLPKRKVLLFAALVIFLLLIFRACSSPAIVKDKLYYIIRSNNWMPLELFGREPNMSAFVDELINEISVTEHLRIHLSTSQNLDPQGLFILLDTNQYDAIVVTFSPNAFIKDKYLISSPIYNAGPVLVVKDSSAAKSLADLNGKAVGIKMGSSQAFDVGRDASLLVGYESMINALEDLENNVISGVVMEAELAQIYTEGFYKGKLKIASAPLTDLGLRLVTKNNENGRFLIENFNNGLKKAEHEGIFENLIKKWGLTNP
jgi:polar amino acid transport system substrate-binding protein